MGDALGLYVEGLRPAKIQKRFGRVDRFLMPGGLGVLSDDTEQSSLVAESLVLYPNDVAGFTRHLRWSLFKWFWSLPPGIGQATAKACLKITLLLKNSGIRSAGNGAAMRSAIIGVFFADDPTARKSYGVSAAKVTHTDERAIEGALFVAELAAACSKSQSGDAMECFDRALSTVQLAALSELLVKAKALAEKAATTEEAAQTLSTSGFVMHTVPFAAFCLLRYSDDPMNALVECINAGGDTDSNAAVLGAWLGSLHGEEAFPPELRSKIVYGPIDWTNLTRALAEPQHRFAHFNYFIALAKNLVALPFFILVAICRFFY